MPAQLFLFIHVLDLNISGVQNGLGLKQFLESRGCEYITTDSKEGEDSGAVQQVCVF